MPKEGNIVLEIYQEENGNEPTVDWIESINDIVFRARIKNRLRRVEIGNFGDYKAVSSGVFELRLNFGPGYRVYFGKKEDVVVLLLCGGDKKSQVKDIKTAIKYWNNYKNRSN